MSSSAEFLKKVREFAQEVSHREGCLLYDVEFGQGSSGRVLRVYIDKDPGPVSIDDCTNVSRGLNLLLDVEDIVPGGRYELEVSSPGVERKLTLPWHFVRAVGQHVRLKLKAPLVMDGSLPQLVVEGLLVESKEGQVMVSKNERQWVVPVEQIAKGQTIFVMEPTPAKGKKKR